jgi:TetR/AcrR family transcriptional regulator, regulator of cefoperazone and chloramphenicol sensitivity
MTSVQAGGVRRGHGTDTRLRILAVSVELFSDRGYAGTSVRDIAEAMGMTKASLYYHFRSKEEILDAVTEPIRTEMEELVAWSAGPPPPAPADLLTRLTGLLSRHAPLLSSVFNDPSAVHRGQLEHARDQFAVFGQALAGAPTPTRLLRARCAIGAVRGGVLGALASDPRFAEPPDGERAVRMLNREEELLDAGQRREVVEAALRALGPDF